MTNFHFFSFFLILKNCSASCLLKQYLSLPDTRKPINYRKTIKKRIAGWFRSNNSYQPSFFSNLFRHRQEQRGFYSPSLPSTAFPTRFGLAAGQKGAQNEDRPSFTPSAVRRMVASILRHQDLKNSRAVKFTIVEQFAVQERPPLK